MDGKNLANTFQFHYDCVFHDQIKPVAAIEALILVSQWHRNLSFELQISKGEFMTKAFFIYFFKQARPNSLVHFNSSPNDLFCEFLINQLCSRSGSAA